MEKYKEIIIKSTVFLFILIFLILRVNDILSNPTANYAKERSGMTEIYKHEDKYDVCFLGTSRAYMNVCNQNLYEKYGIAGVSVGQPIQPIYLTKHILTELLKHQHPKVVFLDVASLFYNEEYVKYLSKLEYEVVHNTYDVIKNPIIKQQVLSDVILYNNEIDLWDYYSQLYYKHENWKVLTKESFIGCEINDCMNGNVALMNIQEGCLNSYDISDNETVANINGKTYLDEIVCMCEKAHAELIFINSGVSWSKARHKAIVELAKEYDIDFIDVNEYMEEIGFSFDLDMYDDWHFNLSGAIKWTDYLGEYLTQNYDFPDRRNDKSYDWYKEQSEIFNQQKEMMSAKQALLSAVTFDEYLAVLKGLNHYENAIFISVYDEASYCLTETEQVLLRDLGLNQDLTGKYRYSYAAFIYGNKVKEEISPNETVTVEGNIGDINYEVVSGGLTAGVGDASISINGKEYLQKGRGFNIVVYNTKLKQMISSAYFDTCTFVNPPQSRITTETINQHETAPNVWETER